MVPGRNLNWLDKTWWNKMAWGPRARESPLYQKHLPNVITTLNKERRARRLYGEKFCVAAIVVADFFFQPTKRKTFSPCNQPPLFFPSSLYYIYVYTFHKSTANLYSLIKVIRNNQKWEANFFWQNFEKSLKKFFLYRIAFEIWKIYMWKV